MAAAKHIGIVACSAEGAALCYKTICIEAAQYMGEYGHPEITCIRTRFPSIWRASVLATGAVLRGSC